MAAKPIDKVLIRKIRFGKKNMRTQPKIIKFDPGSPDTRNRDKTSFEKLCENLQNCLPSSSFFFTKSNLNRILDRSIHRKYHRSCSVRPRNRGKGCSLLGRGDLLLLLLLMWYLLLYHILQIKLFPFCLPRCILICHLNIVSYGKLYNRACRAT